MLFNSIQFLIFFPTVAALYFLIPHKFRWFLLLVSSCIFYMAFMPVYILILAVTILIDYFAGILIERTEGGKKRTFLIISILSTCIVLLVFKYFNFFNSNLANVAHFFHWNYPIGSLNIILPIGLSFHTFQSLSYVIEVYRGNQKAERNFGIYALYVMFFPQLVAGPIERPQNLLHQFYEKHYFDYKRVTDGLKLMAWGMFKKIVIADNVAVIVNTVYNNVHSYYGFSLILATVLFAFQIYCDFSGYSDIAIGSAQVMGFKLMTNFKRPYFSKSVPEFWRRWHISLSTWFKDYVYISMGGNRVSFLRKNFNLFFVFLVSGLWHGANWTYILWGAIHGTLLVISNITSNVRKRLTKSIGLDKLPALHKIIKVTITFSLVCFAWIFFRANSINDAFYIVKNIFSSGHPFSFSQIQAYFTAMKLDIYNTTVIAASIAILETVHLIQRKHSIRELISNRPGWIRWGLYFGVILSILMFGYFYNQQFIYFQF
ncbi:MAG TPA: MBOAT family O-acyltransferase [Clostridia bacterium]|nr:MBOAT family O-acyltransferase [Clostridia bacterium]